MINRTNNTKLKSPPTTEYKRTILRSPHGKSNKVPTKVIAPSSESSLTPLSLTKAHFLDAYSKGKWNLSNVPCPPCFENVGFMQPPECYNESFRGKAVEYYMGLKHWEEKSIFKKIVSKVRKDFKVTGVSISLLDTSRTIVKYETLLDMSDIPRIASIDSHTILSHGYFLLLDASKDWRTSQNPFVTGVPYIKFYCGVPLITPEKELIGVMAVFDPFPKPEFSVENCKKLQNYSEELMTILNTPYEKVIKKNKETESKDKINSELAELSLKLGRATSRGSLRIVFEKDGSGGPYSQNHNFRFTKLSEFDKEVKISNKHLCDKLFKVGSLRNAATILSKTIAVNYMIDLVYILEIRIAEPYQIQNEFFPLENRVEVENYKYANKLVKNSNEGYDYMTRIIGIYGSKSSSLNFESSIHYKAFTSEFGIHYKNLKKNSIYNSGVLMPFYRHNSKLVRKNKLTEHSNVDENKKIDVYLRSGGYIIALFSESLNYGYSSDLISNFFSSASILRKIYISA